MTGFDAEDPLGIAVCDPQAAWRRYREGRSLLPPTGSRALLDRLVGVVYSLSVPHGFEYFLTRADLDEELELARLLDVLEDRGFDRERLEQLVVERVVSRLAARGVAP